MQPDLDNILKLITEDMLEKGDLEQIVEVLLLAISTSSKQTKGEIDELESKIREEVVKLIQEYRPKDGNDGKTPTTEELLSIILPLIPEPQKGDKGDDYVLTEKDKKDIAKEIKVPVVEKVIEKTEVIRETPIVTEKIVEVAVKDTPDEVVGKVNSSKNKIKKGCVEGLEDIERLAKENAVPPTTSFINGRRAKNIDFIGASVAYKDDTAVVTITGGTGGAVDSVNGQTGVVVLDTGDIADTLNKRYVTDADLVVLGNTSGTNTGDQDLSGLVPYTGATNDLDLGVYGLRQTNGGAFSFISNDGNALKIAGLSTSDVNTVGFTSQISNLSALFDLSNITSTDKSFAFPDNSGTLALTSDIHDAVTITGEDYLSLSGQQITANPIDLDNLSATGTPSATTFLRGDNTWATPADTGITQLTGDVTAGPGSGSQVATLASIISAGGPTGSATVAPIITYDAKGRLTAVSSATITPAVGSITGLGTGVAAALGVNVGSAGAFVVNGGALGTPSSGTLTNATGLPLSTGVTGDLPFANLTQIAGFSILAKAGTGTGDVAELTAGTDSVLMRSGSGDLTFGTIVTNQITADAVTYAKIQNVSTNNRLLGRSTSGAGDVEEITTGTGILTFLTTPSSANLLAALTDETGTGVAVFGTAPTFTTSIKAASSATIGTTTLSEKFGNAYLGNGADLFPDNDIYGLWNRKINYGFTPDEHWGQNADELSWTGFATYTGFVTPADITTTLSAYSVAHNNGVKRAFRYRAAATGGQIYLRARATVTFLNGGGLMVDDGVDAGDGNGANNFYRVYIKQTALAGVFQVFEEYRTGGGAVTTNAGPTIPYGEYIGIGLRCLAGTLWSSWTANPFTFSEAQSAVQFTGGTAAMSWTPARVGLFAEFSATDFGRRAVWDWYDESNI